LESAGNKGYLTDSESKELKGEMERKDWAGEEMAEKAGLNSTDSIRKKNKGGRQA